MIEEPHRGQRRGLGTQSMPLHPHGENSPTRQCCVARTCCRMLLQSLQVWEG